MSAVSAESDLVIVVVAEELAAKSDLADKFVYNIHVRL